MTNWTAREAALATALAVALCIIAYFGFQPFAAHRLYSGADPIDYDARCEAAARAADAWAGLGIQGQFEKWRETAQKDCDLADSLRRLRGG